MTAVLGDLVELSKGRKPVRILDDQEDGSVRLIQISDLRPRAQRKFCPIVPNATQVSEGDVVIAWDGANAGESAWGLSGALGSTMGRVRPNTQFLDTAYLGHFLKSQESRIRGNCRGATVPHVDPDYLRSLRVPLPSLPEQRRIAAILDHAETLRAKRRHTLELLNTLTQSIFTDMFGDPDTSWPEVSVASFAANEKGAIRTGPFGSQLLHSEFVSEGVAVLGIDNAVNNTFEWGQRRYITEEKFEQLSRYRVRPGDVLITIMGTVGRCAIVPSDMPKAINTKHLCCITLDVSKCLPEYLWAFFLFDSSAQRYLGRTSKGAIMAGLNMGIIKGMPVRLPRLELQREFADRVECLGRERAKTVLSLADFDALAKSLEQRAFRGDL